MAAGDEPCGASTAVALEEEASIFPQERPGLSYALNWSLAAAGVTPSGEAYRNLKLKDLQELGASLPDAKTGVVIYAKGGHSSGAQPLSNAQFNRLFKEATSRLSSAPKLFVHDGAIGSSSIADARVRVISDFPSSALTLAGVATPAPTRILTADAFPLTVYIPSNFRPTTVEGKDAFIAIDYDTSIAVFGGEALADSKVLKEALAALAGPTIMKKGGVPLPGRLLAESGSTVLVLAPEAVLKAAPSLVEGAVFSDPGLVLTASGVARLFQARDSSEPNLYKLPSAIVLVTLDSSGAVPGISKLQPSQASYYFLAGYNGEDFVPAYASGPTSIEPLELAKAFSSVLRETEVPVFLVNAQEGDKAMPDKELAKLIFTTVSQKLPKSKTKKPAEAAVNALRKRFDEFMSAKFPELPEGFKA
eukprot:SM000142S00506  [mRNA]  locus=s142:70711:74299:- [translate_table: standard]